MTLILIHILVGVLAIIGLTSVLCGMYTAVHTMEDHDRYSLLLLRGDNADLRLKSAMIRCQEERVADGGVLAVDIGLNDEQKKACRTVSGICPDVQIMTVTEFENWLGGKQGEHDNRTARNRG